MTLLLEHVACDLCGGEDYRVRYRKPDNWLWSLQFEFPVVECTQCGLVFVNPRPTPDSMAQFYPAEHYGERGGEDWQRRYARELELLPNLDGKRILDIGCAGGDFLAHVKTKFPTAETHGIDAYVSRCNHDDIDFTHGDFAQSGLPAAYFDVITAWAVFEHLHSPRAYFSEVARVLKSDGAFTFLVTNAESLYGSLAFTEDVPRHTYHFSEGTLRKYARACGLELSALHYDDSIWDGRGIGALYHSLQRAVGVTWERRYFGKLNRLQVLAGRVGNALDRQVFRGHWEAKLRRSGVVIATMTKPHGGATEDA